MKREGGDNKIDEFRGMKLGGSPAAIRLGNGGDTENKLNNKEKQENVQRYDDSHDGIGRRTRCCLQALPVSRSRNSRGGLPFEE